MESAFLFSLALFSPVRTPLLEAHLGISLHDHTFYLDAGMLMSMEAWKSNLGYKTLS